MARKGNKYQKNEKLKIGGIHIYIDSHGRAVYYDVLTKIGYVLDDYETAYRPYSMRFVIGIFAAVLIYMFEAPLWLSILVGVLAYGFMEVKFRFFLKKVPQLLDFKPEKRAGMIDTAVNDETKKIILKFILYTALAVLIIFNAYDQKYEGLILGANWLIALFGLYFAIIQILAFFKKSKA